jgi:ATP-dependent DNA helicase RecQ
MKQSLLEVIQKHWGYSSLRPLQEEAMLAALSSKDSLVVMPTGGGKSLCFQAPALLSDGATVVVSPLISLMKDQVDGLRENGIAAAQVNSSMSLDDIRITERELFAKRLKLLFVSPERLALQPFRDMLRRANVKTFAIDEAHCISHWGHDFRPEYRQLRTIREEFPHASMHAYTATATPEVREDIARQLGLRDPIVLVGDFDRPNLTYRVLPRQDESKQVFDVIEKHRGEAGIIYCTRRKDVDSLAEKLRRRGLDVVAYHAGLSQDERREAQDKFSKEQCDLVVATVAFGMGIDRSNVRFVLHTAMPKSVEHYQQESGRAGRDGLEAECVLLYSGADFMTWKSMITDTSTDPEYTQSAIRHLNDMDRYCSGAACRHRALVEYFGQPWEGAACNACDICLGETEEVEDALIVAQKILSCVVRVRESFGVSHVVGVLRGEDTERIRERQHDQLSTYGLLKGCSRHDVREWVYQLIAQGFLAQTHGEYPVLCIGPRGREVLRGFAEVKLRQPAVRKKDPGERRAPKLPVYDGEYDRDVFQALRTWRREEAQERNVPPYVIFSDKTLRELARVRPTTLYELRFIYGIGDAKLEAFGSAVIEIVRSTGVPAG